MEHYLLDPSHVFLHFRNHLAAAMSVTNPRLRRLNSRFKDYVAFGDNLSSRALRLDEGDDSDGSIVVESARKAAERSRANAKQRKAKQRQVVDPYDCEHSVSGAQRLFLDGSGLYDNPNPNPHASRSSPSSGSFSSHCHCTSTVRRGNS